MNSVLLGMLAETAIHPGTGRSGGVIDLPVAREAVTNYPYIPGSSLKGALRDKAERTGKKAEAKKWFGEADAAGELLVSDARLLLLPVRSLTGSYRWLTCPLIVERLQRDLLRAGFSAGSKLRPVDKGTVHTRGSGNIYLEERQFTIDGEPEQEIIATLEKFIAGDSTRARLGETVAIVNNDDFAWFAGYGLPVQARNRLADDDTKQSKNLWYEESLPPDTLMYALVAARSDSASGAAGSLFKDDPYLQTGGNETVGEGWFIVSSREPAKEGS